MRQFILFVCLTSFGLRTLVCSSSPSSLISACYPNGTFILNNPNVTVFTNVVAFEDIGLASASPCNVSTSGSLVEITDCHLNHAITVHFSDRSANAPNDFIFAGHVTQSYQIQCNQITGPVNRTVDTNLHVHTTTIITSEPTVTTNEASTTTEQSTTTTTMSTVTTPLFPITEEHVHVHTLRMVVPIGTDTKSASRMWETSTYKSAHLEMKMLDTSRNITGSHQKVLFAWIVETAAGKRVSAPLKEREKKFLHGELTVKKALRAY